MVSDEDLGNSEGFDWGSPGDRPLGANERQVLFAQACLAGHSQIESARLAGYQGDEQTLRSTASRTFHSAKVQALLRMARMADDEDPEGTPAELRRILWREARHGANPASRLRASEILSKYFHEMQTAERQKDASPLVVAREANATGSPLHAAVGVLFLAAMTQSRFHEDHGEMCAFRMDAHVWRRLQDEFPAVAAALDSLGFGGGREPKATKLTESVHRALEADREPDHAV